jgi:hypothetical protein
MIGSRAFRLQDHPDRFADTNDLVAAYGIYPAVQPPSMGSEAPLM